MKISRAFINDPKGCFVINSRLASNDLYDV